MATYTFRAANWVLLFFTGTLSAILGFVLAFTFASVTGIVPTNNTVGETLLFILCILAINPFVILMVRLIAMAKVQITLHEHRISIKWLERFLFFKKKDVSIPFHEIAAFVDQSDRYWEWVKIELNNGATYRIWRYNASRNADYEKFVADLLSALQQYNRAMKESAAKEGLTPVTIQRAKTLFETTGMLIAGVVFVLLIIGVSIYGIWSSPTDHGPYLGLAFGCIGALFIWFQIYARSRKDKYPPLPL